MAAVGSPAGALVAASRVRREIDDVLGGRLHDVDIVVAVRAAPTEGQELTVGGPGGVDDVTLVREIEQVHVGAVGVHHVELGDTAAIADEDDGLAGLGVPGRRSATAVDVGDVEFGIASHGRGENELCAVGRPGGGAVCAAEAGEGDDFAGVRG